MREVAAPTAASSTSGELPAMIGESWCSETQNRV